ncbi:MAG TPA: hypothetical protein VGR37_19835 [Longimicrobiaceae bacterium]|nr:hypothetical protein [Longimicrobiaceae bacterium]
MNPLSRALVLGLALAATACASSPGNVARPANASAARGSSSNVITHEEIVATGAANALEIVRSLRPAWLRTRGSQSLRRDDDDNLVVYLNNARLGPPAALQQVAAADVGTIRFFNAAAANYRFGPGHSHGAIQVISEGADPSRIR